MDLANDAQSGAARLLRMCAVRPISYLLSIAASHLPLLLGHVATIAIISQTMRFQSDAFSSPWLALLVPLFVANSTLLHYLIALKSSDAAQALQRYLFAIFSAIIPVMAVSISMTSATPPSSMFLAISAVSPLGILPGLIAVGQHRNSIFL
jgi:hypothetical protein